LGGTFYEYQQHNTANMNHAYVCELMNDKLGTKMSELDYRLKYEIVYGFMPRPDYIDELKKLFKTIDNMAVDTKIKFIRIRKKDCPSLLQHKNKEFIVNGIKYRYDKTKICNFVVEGNYGELFADKTSSHYRVGKEQDDRVIFYKYICITARNLRLDDDVMVRRYYSQRHYYDRKNIQYIKHHYNLNEWLRWLTRQFTTCKRCIELYKRENRRPTKRITKLTLRKMVWELIRDDIDRWFIELLDIQSVRQMISIGWRSDISWRVR